MTRDLDSAEEEAARDIKDGRYDHAFRKYRELAETGSVTAQLRLGWMFETGKGVEQSLMRAEQWYLKAAATNDPQGQFYVANVYRRTDRYHLAVEWLDKSASQGYVPAIYALGTLYHYGAGVPRDRQKAFRYFAEAAAKGHLFASRKIAGDMMSGSRGIHRIPAGVLLMLRVLWRAIKLGRNEPDSDLIKY